MKIKVLVENTATWKEFECEHGLSLYIETKEKKILFDVGASELFLQNAKKLGVEIADINYLIISHGHYDHGGGLKAFLNENNTAEVFLHRKAFEKHLVFRGNGESKSIGLDDSLKNKKQIVFTSDRFFINKGLHVFSNIIEKEARPAANCDLLIEEEGIQTNDNFAHEQNLTIEEDGKLIMITGCAHNGIINILEHFKDLKGRMPDYVIGGLHLSSSNQEKNESDDSIERIGKYLMDTKAKFYTCHCTGIEAYQKLKTIMGDCIEYIATGSEVVI